MNPSLGSSVSALPPGGRDRVLRKHARRMARQIAPRVTATDDELAAIETALCTTPFGVYTLRVSRGAGLVYGMPSELPKRVQETLRRFMKRNHAAWLASRKKRPVVGSGLPGDPSIVGELPEPFSRPARARGATSRDNDMAWLDLPLPPPKPRINLPLPEERKLIELPDPPRRGRAER
jgi:hypothetical protein